MINLPPFCTFVIIFPIIYAIYLFLCYKGVFIYYYFGEYKKPKNALSKKQIGIVISCYVLITVIGFGTFRNNEIKFINLNIDGSASRFHELNTGVFTIDANGEYYSFIGEYAPKTTGDITSRSYHVIKKAGSDIMVLGDNEDRVELKIVPLFPNDFTFKSINKSLTIILSIAINEISSNYLYFLFCVAGVGILLFIFNLSYNGWDYDIDNILIWFGIIWGVISFYTYSTK